MKHVPVTAIVTAALAAASGCGLVEGDEADGRYNAVYGIVYDSNGTAVAGVEVVLYYHTRSGADTLDRSTTNVFGFYNVYRGSHCTSERENLYLTARKELGQGEWYLNSQVRIEMPDCSAESFRQDIYVGRFTCLLCFGL